MPRNNTQERDEITSEYRIFMEILGILRNKSGAELKLLATQSGVALSTIYYWMDGFTRKPRIDTLTKVAFALGYEIHLRRTRQRNLRSV